jgi:hypothetical protein
VHALASALVAYWINCLPTLQLYDAAQTLSAVIGKLMKEGKTDEVDSTKAQVIAITIHKSIRLLPFVNNFYHRLVL